MHTWAQLSPWGWWGSAPQQLDSPWEDLFESHFSAAQCRHKTYFSTKPSTTMHGKGKHTAKSRSDITAFGGDSSPQPCGDRRVAKGAACEKQDAGEGERAKALQLGHDLILG